MFLSAWKEYNSKSKILVTDMKKRFILVISLVLILASSGCVMVEDDATSNAEDTMTKETEKDNRIAVIETSMGTITAELYEERAPNTTANFIGLAERGFYDGLIFHRVINDFMIQGGCPKGTGIGGSGTNIKLENHPELTHVDGALAMARSQHPDSASSQFYICDGAQSFLDGQYAVFGRTIDGMDVVRAIAEVKTDSGNKPVEDVVIIKVSIADRE